MYIFVLTLCIIIPHISYTADIPNDILGKAVKRQRLALALAESNVHEISSLENPLIDTFEGMQSAILGIHEAYATEHPETCGNELKRKNPEIEATRAALKKTCKRAAEYNIPLDLVHDPVSFMQLYYLHLYRLYRAH